MRAISRVLGGTRGRLILLQVVILAVAAAIADVSIYQLVTIPAQTSLDSSLYDQLHTVESNLTVDQSAVKYTTGTVPGEGGDGAAIEATVIDKNGGVVAASPKQSLPTLYLTSLGTQVVRDQQSVTADSLDSKHVLRRVYAEAQTFGDAPNQVVVAVIVSRQRAELDNTRRRLLVTLGLGSLLLALVGGALAYWVTGRALRPVGQIAALARTLSEQDLHRRVDVKGPPDEIGELVQTFNLMLGRLEAAFDSLHRFTADASHELRAPLTVIRSQVEVAITRRREPEEYERVLRSVLDQVQMLSRIAEQLLLIARADAGELHPERQTIEVADFVHEVAARWEAVAEGRRVELSVDAPDAGELQADPALTRRVLDNLLHNAFRYTPELSTVRLSAWIEGSGWVFEVADQGPGVDVEYRSRIFERFARADSARSKGGGGAGLGLSLGAAIARAHGGSLDLVDKPGAGAIFRLRLPE